MKSRNSEVIISVGMSRAGDCGVRDYAGVLSRRLEGLGHGAETVWIERPSGRGWLAGLRADARLLSYAIRAFRKRPAAIVFHYSPFVFGAHGVPILAPLLPLAGLLRGVKVTTVLHELFFPWGKGGVRGFLWAFTQRAALVPVVMGSRALVVTREDRAEWLTARLGVKRSRISIIPVCSTIPVVHQSGPGESSGSGAFGGITIGTFGWGSRTTPVNVVLDALRLGISDGVEARLLLIGGPGPDSEKGRRWSSEAELRGLSDAVAFTGASLPPGEVSKHLSGLDVYLHADSEGLSPGRTSLAAAMEHGKPTIAFRVRGAWTALREGEEVLLADADPDGLHRCLLRLVGSKELRSKLARGARTAYLREMHPEKTAKRLAAAVLSNDLHSAKRVKGNQAKTREL